jgi:hypothetical protein
MARLYQYADSNDDSGYFVIGDSGNATFQVKPIAKRLLDKLEYDPPIKTEQQGPRVPSELHWLLFDIGWMFTGDNEAGEFETEEVPDQLDVDNSLTEEMVNDIRQFAENRKGEGIQELVERLDLQDVEQEQLATLSDDKHKPLEQYILGYMQSVLQNTEEESIEGIDVTVLDLSDDQTERGSLNLIVDAAGTERNYRHSIISSIEDGISIVSATEASQTWKERGRMDRHRGHLLASLDSVSAHEDMKLNFDNDEISGEITYITSFDVDISLPDDMKSI